MRARRRCAELARAKFSSELIRETRNGELYEYFPLGEHIVAAPGVCGGRPTFKGTRLEVRVVLNLLAAGRTAEQVVAEYRLSGISQASVSEAIRLAEEALRAKAETGVSRDYGEPPASHVRSP